MSTYKSPKIKVYAIHEALRRYRGAKKKENRLYTDLLQIGSIKYMNYIEALKETVNADLALDKILQEYKEGI